MQRSELGNVDCSIAQTLNVVGDFWSFLILRNCFRGMRTFDAFQRDLDISTSMLTVRLKKLTAEGVLTRTQSKSDGRSFEYRLTDRGHDLYPIVVAMLQWGEKWKPGDQGPRLELFDKTTGQPIKGVHVLSGDNRPLNARDVVARGGVSDNQDIHKAL